MKKVLNEKAPVWLMNFIKKIWYKLKLFTIFMSDCNIFRKSSFAISNLNDPVKLQAKITLHYHSLEKGFTNEDIRYNFGHNAIRNLIYSLDKYIKRGYDLSNERVLSAIRVLETYIDFHKGREITYPNLINKFDGYIFTLNKSKIEYKSKRQFDILDLTNFEIPTTFESLLKNRRSIREYDSSNVDKEIINNIIRNAQLTPSVCNRQPWRIHFFNEKEKITAILKLQNGLNNQRIQNIPNLFIISVDMRYFGNGKERQEPYIAGGMYSMNILNLLESNNLAACALNGSVDKNDHKRIAKVANLDRHEKIVMFITFGIKTKQVKVPSSDRDNVLIKY